METTDRGLRELAGRLRAAQRITILTGAGVSAASGVPTFRGEAGLWRNFRAEELATQEAFSRDPRLVWEWYAWRRQTIARCRPNAAHEAIARWSDPAATAAVPGEGGRCVRVVTQNVDDLHLRAGTHGLVRLHGSIWELACARSCGALSWRDERAPLPELPPRCPACGGLARPAVVWFGESLSRPDVDAATQACQCDVFLTVGTSAIVYPAAGLVHEARRQGAFTAEINTEATPASSAVHLALHGPAEEILPRLDATAFSPRQ